MQSLPSSRLRPLLLPRSIANALVGVAGLAIVGSAVPAVAAAAPRPSVHVLHAPAKTSTSRTARVTWRKVGKARAVCSLDRRREKTCASPYRATHLAVGAHNLRIRLVGTKRSVLVRWRVASAGPATTGTTLVTAAAVDPVPTVDPTTGSTGTDGSGTSGGGASGGGATGGGSAPGAPGGPTGSGGTGATLPDVGTIPEPAGQPAPSAGSYVATTGSDAADGSADHPWLTLQHAVNTATPGSTVWLRGGAYTGAVITRSGASAASPTTIASYPNEVATISTPPSGANTIEVKSGASHIVLSRLVVSGAVGVYHAGVMVDGSATDVHIVNSTLRDNHSFGLRTYQVNDVEVRDSLITGNDTGIMINYAGEGVSITGNQINSNTGMVVNDATPGNDNGANGIQFVKSTGNVTVTGNTVAHNRALSHDYGWDGGAFEVYAASNVHISGNVTYDNQDVLETGTDSGIACAGNTFTDNVNWGGNDKSQVASRGPVASGMLLRCAQNMVISHNTFDDLDWYVYDLSNSSRFSGSLDGLQITDNINLTHQVNGQVEKVYCFEIAVPSTVTINRNLSWNTTGGTLASFSGHPDTTQLTDVRTWTNSDLNGMQADPHLTDPTNHNYHPTGQTPMSSAGTRIFN